MAGIDKAYLLRVIGKLQPSEVEQLKYILKDSLTEDERAQLQSAEDLVKILMKGIFLEDNLGNSRKTERQKIKEVFEIVRSKDLAAHINGIGICPMKGLTEEITSELIKRFIDAARFDDFNEVTNMLHAGVPVNSQDKDGYSALYWAVFNNNTDVVDMLISKKADVNLRNSHYWTPLHAAAHNSDTGMMKFLLQNGAEPSIKNNRGETALDIARTYLREAEIHQLLEK